MTTASFESANPMQSMDLGASTAKQAADADAFEVYGNGNTEPVPTTRRMTSASERLNSFNSTMTGRTYDRTLSQQALLGPRRPRPHKIWRKKFIKVLVVGDSGLGKTTLVKTLLSTPGERLQVHDGTYTPADQFLKDPDSLCSTVTWKDEEDRVIWVYRIQDTPGYGDDLDINNHINMIVGYLNSRNEKWLDMESATDRAQDLSEVEDPRVDVCLFCVPPHRLRAIDIKYMHEMGKHVPIIPVITKADTMTIREAQNYKQEVFGRLQNPNVPHVRGKINTFRFDKETLDRAGMADVGGSTPPFLVIASNDINDEMNQMDVPVFWPERRYPWGTAQAFNPDHSDLFFLRALLLKEALEDIAKDKRARYETWRSHRLSRPKVGSKLRNFALSTLVPVAAAFYCAKKGVDMETVKKLFKGRQTKQVEAAPAAEPLPEPTPAPAAEPAAAAEPAKKKGWF